jgi:hypothetical protein
MIIKNTSFVVIAAGLLAFSGCGKKDEGTATGQATARPEARRS